MTTAPFQKKYVPFRKDIPLGLHTWIFFLSTFFVFVLISMLLKTGVVWGAMASIAICFVSHSVWHSTASAVAFKRLITKPLSEFLVEVIRKRSFKEAADQLFSIKETSETEMQDIIQEKSRWLMLVPLILLLPTLVIDWLVDANLRYYLIAEAYYALVGLAWMILCRKGRLMYLPFVGDED